MEADNHALVIGASGLIGWSVVNELLQDAPRQSFRKVTALVNRPLSLQESFWPAPSNGRPKLQLVSGANLLCDDAELEGFLKKNVQDVTSISHVYYFGILHLLTPRSVG